MSYACLVLGESGTGKTCSLRNLDPQKHTSDPRLSREPLPFRSTGWKEIKAKGDGNNIIVCADPQKIINFMKVTPFDVIVVDDWQYILASMFMDARNVKGYDKFTDIGGAGFDIAQGCIRTSGEQTRLRPRPYDFPTIWETTFASRRSGSYWTTRSSSKGCLRTSFALMSKTESISSPLKTQGTTR